MDRKWCKESKEVNLKEYTKRLILASKVERACKTRARWFFQGRDNPYVRQLWTLQLTSKPSQIATAPLVLKWFQLRLSVSIVSFSWIPSFMHWALFSSSLLFDNTSSLSILFSWKFELHLIFLIKSDSKWCIYKMYLSRILYLNTLQINICDLIHYRKELYEWEHQ